MKSKHTKDLRMPNPLTKPNWEHASSRFMCVTPGVIDLLQTNFINRISLVDAIPGIDSDTAGVIVAESLEADRIWNLPPDQLLSGFNQGPESDFKSAVLAELLFEAAEVAHMEVRPDTGQNLWAVAMASLEKIARSLTASPLLWYEDIYFELAQAAQRDVPEEALDWLKRSLVHNLHFDEGSNGVQILRDLAESCLAKGELERGLQMLTALLNHAPEDVWTYNLIAISFDRFGLTKLGLQAIERGLQLIDLRGDEDRLRKQFEECRINMQNSTLRDREVDINPMVIDAFQESLNLDFDAGQPRPIAQLCLELVPDLDRITVKRPLTSAQMPLPDPRKTFQLLSQLKASTQKKRTRRRRRKSKHSDA
jgi:tetratricopeptide (TPR) repeat protein